MKIQTVKKIGALLVVVAFGGISPLQAATVDLGLQLVTDNVLANSSGADLGAGAVFIGSWKDSVSNYSAALASAVAAAAATADPAAALRGALGSYFTVGVADSWSSMYSGTSLYVRNITDDTGLGFITEQTAPRYIDAVFFTVGAAEFGSIRWNDTWPATDALGRAVEIALAVPSLDSDAAPSILVGSLVDNGDGTGKFQAIPEPTSGILVGGAGCLFCLVRSFQRKS
jgi:hypothetical protein